ncbi:hypothetical protein M413DRAFT_277378 [Hebeloma cylindrosporum]|uniref:Protein kinase domain-containing protein n=1 Tax=Hebeloma cylindrosporum TaxID=76867 RepID=A0A0C2XHH5_HEBCY|nr:hypothetical protein M413DRAFT_277378 [Hebeloma cylindrosporum h7]
MKEKEKLKNRLEAFLKDPHSKTERPNGFEMMIGEPNDDDSVVMAYVVLPEVPSRMPVEEAHLYLSPAHAIGVGNHSFVYDAEFEVPRSFLVKEELCMDCVQADIEELLEERRQDLENARPGKLITTTTVVPPYLMTCGPGDDKTQYLLEEGSETTTIRYEGPYDVVVQTRVKYQNLERAPYCEHLKARETSIHPLTTKVSVAAKLSLEHDEHLRFEANNYQRFPKHFFEHWSGYNIIRPFHQPVPLGAIVPQFYGYYKVDEESREDDDEYMSPILLIEKCGTPITFDELSIDDKQECASLLYRLHEAAWTHGSVYERNILRQPGPITASQAERTLNQTKRGGYGKDWSYRLIDFGRAEYVGDKGSQRQVEDAVRLDAWKMDKWANGFQDHFG